MSFYLLNQDILKRCYLHQTSVIFTLSFSYFTLFIFNLLLFSSFVLQGKKTTKQKNNKPTHKAPRLQSFSVKTEVLSAVMNPKMPPCKMLQI